MNFRLQSTAIPSPPPPHSLPFKRKSWQIWNFQVKLKNWTSDFKSAALPPHSPHWKWKVGRFQTVKSSLTSDLKVPPPHSLAPRNGSFSVRFGDGRLTASRRPESVSHLPSRFVLFHPTNRSFNVTSSARLANIGYLDLYKSPTTSTRQIARGDTERH